MAAALSKAMRNIALIGMPGSGKSSVARSLHQITGRPVFDTDEMVEKKTGISIPLIIETKGIEFFRRLESEALNEAGKQSGAIIATGGGAVTQPRNLPLLRQNSRIVWIQRDPALLSVAGRPLSLGKGIEALLRERRPLYEAWSEAAYLNEDVDRTAKGIAEDIL